MMDPAARIAFTEVMAAARRCLLWGSVKDRLVFWHHAEAAGSDVFWQHLHRGTDLASAQGYAYDTIAHVMIYGPPRYDRSA